MKKFEDLPGNNQALILAKLALELKTRGSPDIHDLAEKLHTDLLGIWWGICRKAGQPLCEPPIETLYEPQ